MNPRPFYPVQTPTGETYVVDGRTKRIVSKVSASFDTTARWVRAKAEAERRNRAHVQRTYALRQRLAVIVIIVVAGAFAFGALSRCVPSGITGGL